MTVWLVDTHGRAMTIRDVMLHHVVFYRVAGLAGRLQWRPGEAIYGTGEENQQLRLPRGYGYRVRRGDRWRMNAMLMSHSVSGERVCGVSRHGDHRRAAEAGAPFWVRASGCGDQVATRSGAAAAGLDGHAHVRLESAVRRADRRRRRPSARRR